MPCCAQAFSAREEGCAGGVLGSGSPLSARTEPEAVTQSAERQTSAACGAASPAGCKPASLESRGGRCSGPLPKGGLRGGLLCHRLCSWAESVFSFKKREKNKPLVCLLTCPVPALGGGQEGMGQGFPGARCATAPEGTSLAGLPGAVAPMGGQQQPTQGRWSPWPGRAFLSQWPRGSSQRRRGPRAQEGGLRPGQP